MLNRFMRLKSILITLLFLFIINIQNLLVAQGITLPNEPSQAPIGGLNLLAVLGIGLAYKKLKNRK